MVNIFLFICLDRGWGVMEASSWSKGTAWCCWQAGRWRAWPVQARSDGFPVGTPQVLLRYIRIPA